MERHRFLGLPISHLIQRYASQLGNAKKKFMWKWRQKYAKNLLSIMPECKAECGKPFSHHVYVMGEAMF